MTHLVREYRFGESDAERTKLEERSRRSDLEATADQDYVGKQLEVHAAEHLAERVYAEDTWFKGEECHRVKAFSIDAPTEETQ